MRQYTTGFDAGRFRSDQSRLFKPRSGSKVAGQRALEYDLLGDMEVIKASTKESVPLLSLWQVKP